jgi:DNA topoisomerase-6 subunit B
MAPSTRSVLTVGEESLSKSINRLGKVDFFSVMTRKPTICDFKPVVVEVALARFIDRGDEQSPVQLLRFANRVPLQFDKSGCAITWAIESVNWKSYGLGQPKDSLPLGPYVFAVSVVSPFIKFKNASKETIDASEELVEEIRRALMQAGQKLSRHIKSEMKEADLERKLAHIEQFGPILVEKLVLLSGANDARKKKAEEGLRKILGRDSEEAVSQLEEAQSKLAEQKKKEAKKAGLPEEEIVAIENEKAAKSQKPEKKKKK